MIDISLKERSAAQNSKRAALSSFIGSAIEWYDFALFGTMSALVFNSLFFAGLSATAGTVAALATFAVGYVIRPLGAVLFGQIGDRIGRKTMLIASVVLMGISTFLITFLPTYATIGVWAPVILLLLRMLQGLSVGGEWGGAVTLTIEHAANEKRGLMAGIAQLGGPVGPLLATLMIALTAHFSGDQFLVWGWRIPFAFSLVMLLVGLYIRRNVEESPAFHDPMPDAEPQPRSSFVAVLTRSPKSLILGVAVCIAPLFGSVISNVYALGYAKSLGYTTTQTLLGTLIATPTAIIVSLLAARFSDKVGRRPIFITGAVLIAIFSFALFPLIGSVGLLILGNVLYLGVAHAMMWGTMGAILPELFPTSERTTGAALGYQLGSIVAGFGPVLAATITATTGHTLGVSFLVTGASLISVVAILAARETSRVALRPRTARPSESATPVVS
jgi:MHS family shikimate/dehydroshikimate transporter-like MFS transporter